MGISSAFIFRRKNQTLRADAKFVGREIRGCTLGARKRNVYTAAPVVPATFFPRMERDSARRAPPIPE